MGLADSGVDPPITCLCYFLYGGGGGGGVFVVEVGREWGGETGVLLHFMHV